MKTDHKLKDENPELYRVARTCGTEAPFSSAYVHPGHDGMFHCAVCSAPLFSSETQFDSGSGCPSFTDPVVADAVTLYEDTSHGMRRTEVRCKNCDAHLGHVFPDGPKKDGIHYSNRFCINGVSLDLQKKPSHE
jgi:peptide-methionine (R)-S-oxide reductase